MTMRDEKGTIYAGAEAIPLPQGFHVVAMPIDGGGVKAYTKPLADSCDLELALVGARIYNPGAFIYPPINS